MQSLQHSYLQCRRAVQAQGFTGQNVVVSKGQPVAALRQLYEIGVRQFAENRLTEALDKIAQMPADCQWHYIGQVQSRACRRLAVYFDWVHSVHCIKIAQRLSQYGQHRTKPLSVCVQLSPGFNRHGVAVADLPSLVEAMQPLKALHCRGVMAMADPHMSELQRDVWFAEVQQWFARLQQQAGFDTLSMGMSGDYKQAIAHGATMLRLGRVIFHPAIG